MDDSTARVLGGIYIALCAALTDEGARLSYDMLRSWANNPDIPAEDRRIYGCISHSASTTAEEAEAENEEFTWWNELNSRPQLRLIGGGAAETDLNGAA